MKINDENIKKEISDYYGQTLESQNDLKTSACCLADSVPRHHREILKMIDSEIVSQFYGCGSPLPLDIKGLTVLDLGCGTGRDVYLASKLVGEQGSVIGVDMTQQQIEVARKYEDMQMQTFGYSHSNVKFYLGDIEDLSTLNIKENSIDVVISNCVINLSSSKEKVFSEIYRVLKKGGELLFSDIFSGQRIPTSLMFDPILRGECLSGALYLEDFRRLMAKAGFMDNRVVSQSPLELNDDQIVNKIGMIDFYTMTMRSFKIENVEDRCEDYGQSATYLGTIPESPHTFFLDREHAFTAYKPFLVCGNTAEMLRQSHYAKHFEVKGGRERHFGLFDCAPVMGENNVSGGCC